MAHSIFSSVAQALADSVISFLTLTLSLRFGAVFYKRFLFKHNVRNHVAVQRLFEWTFALSLSLILLIIFDAVGLMHASTRRINWLLNVYALVLTLLAILPPAQVYHILIDVGWLSSRAARAAVLSEALFLLIFWKAVVPPFPTSSTFTAGAASAGADFSPPSDLSLESAMTRLLIIGTTILAVLSGFSAVHLPYTYLASIIRPVSETRVNALSHKLHSALDDVVAHKLTALHSSLHLSRRQSSSNEQHHSQRHDASSIAPNSENKRPSSLSSTNPSHNNINNFTNSYAKSKNHSTSSISIDVASAERTASALFVKYNEVCAQWRDVVYARTRIGRLSTLLGGILLLLCAIRIITAIYNIYTHVTRGGNQNALKTAVFVSASLHRMLLRIGVHVDVTVVYQYATFGFTSVLMCVNLRSVLIRMTSVFSMLAGHDALNSSAAIFLAHLMGTYVISSTILMRSFLPPGSRVFIADVLGTMEFTYFQRWFDVLFISSASLAAVVLAYQSGYIATGYPGSAMSIEAGSIGGAGGGRAARIRAKFLTWLRPRWIIGKHSEKRNLV